MNKGETIKGVIPLGGDSRCVRGAWVVNRAKRQAVEDRRARIIADDDCSRWMASNHRSLRWIAIKVSERMGCSLSTAKRDVIAIRKKLNALELDDLEQDALDFEL